jgi:hypothetical protein
MRMPAWWRRTRAYLGGRFWLPCPICGEHFSGYEVSGATLMTSAFTGKCVCPKKSCREDSERRNQKLMDSPEYKEALRQNYQKWVASPSPPQP